MNQKRENNFHKKLQFCEGGNILKCQTVIQVLTIRKSYVN